MGITDYIKTRLLNNRVEQYNTKRSYWGEDERQPRTGGINTGLDLPDALPPVINKTIANAHYVIKIYGYTLGILKNRIEKAKCEICTSQIMVELSHNYWCIDLKKKNLVDVN